MLTCPVCSKTVYTDGEQSYDGSHAVHVALDGLSVRCEGCGSIVHVVCVAPGSEFCRCCVEALEPVC
jgi:hypothetical protein